MTRLPSVPVPIPSRLYYGWVIVAVALLMNLASSLTNPVVFSFFISPMSEDLGWSKSELSWALTFRLLVAGMSAPFIGSLVDRYGARWLGAAAGLLAGSCLAALAFTHQVWYLYLVFAVSGASGFGGPGGALLTSVPAAKWFAGRRGRAMAIATVGGAFGTVLFIPLAQGLIHAVGWRSAWMVFGVVFVALVTPGCALLMRREPADVGLKIEEWDRAPVRVRRARTDATEDHWTAGEALRNPVLYLLLVAFVVLGLAINGTLVHRVAFWEELGMSPALVAFGTALDPFTVTFSLLAFGVLAERVRMRYLGLVAGIGFAASTLPMVFATNNAWFIVSNGLMFGLSAGAFVTVNNLIWPNYYGTRFLGTIRGLTFPLVIGAAGLGAPLFGLLFDMGLAPRTVWSIALTLFAVSGGLLVVSRPPRRKAAPAQTCDARSP